MCSNACGDRAYLRQHRNWGQLRWDGLESLALARSPELRRATLAIFRETNEAEHGAKSDLHRTCRGLLFRTDGGRDLVGASQRRLESVSECHVVTAGVGMRF